MNKLFDRTLKHLGELNIETSNRDIAAVTFDAIQLLEGQKARITKLELKLSAAHEQGRMQHNISMSRMSSGSGDR